MSIATGSTPAVTTPPPMMGKEAIFSKLSGSSAATGSAPLVNLPLMPILIMDGKDPSGGLSNNTILAGLIANLSLEPADDIDCDDELSPNGDESISTILDSLSLSPETYTPNPDVESQFKQQNPNNTVTVTGPSIKDCISLTTILGEVGKLATNVAGLEATQTNASLEESNNMVAAAITSASDTETAAQRDFNAAVVSIICTSVSCGVSIVMAGYGSTRGGNDTQEEIDEPPKAEAYPVKHEDNCVEVKVDSTEDANNSSGTIAQARQVTDASDQQSSINNGTKEKTNQDSTTDSTNQNDNLKDSTGATDAKNGPNPNPETKTQKKTKTVTDNNKLSKDLKMQTINQVAQAIGQVITGLGDVWAAHVKIGAAYYQGKAQENSTLSSYYGTVQQMCNTNIGTIAQLVISLEGVTNNIAQDMSSMVSSTKA